jgi:FkbH-like protein
MAADGAALATTLADIRRRLAEGGLDHAEIARLGQRILAAAAKPDAAAAGFPLQRVAIVGSSTTDFLARAIACALLVEGHCPVVYQAPFGAYVQEILDPGSGLYRFRPDLVVLAVDARAVIEPLPLHMNQDEMRRALGEKVALFRQLWGLLRERLEPRIIQHLLVPPEASYRGLAERLAPAAPANQVRLLNELLVEGGGGAIQWLEFDRLAAEIGVRQWAGERFFHTAKLTFDPRFLPDYLAFFRGAWRSAFARGKKLLVLDLDNTLWGGVIGDDGVGGILLGPGSAAGEAFHQWGSYLKALRARGVVLAVCSKNDPEIAVAAFEHSHAVLKREDFAAFDCSWENKATALQRIAKSLNLGLDSVVFADDNPAECALVAAELPDVAVVPLGTDPTTFIERLERGHWFNLQRYTGEDLGRAEAYIARAAAEAEALRAPDMASYLGGLDMVGRLWRAGSADLDRLAQLEQKTNQFNLTTRRYPAATLRALMERSDAILLAFKLSDRFGDHGLVSSLIAIAEGDSLRIDSWLMSCRVFSRTSEPLIIRRLAALARERGLLRLTGEYIPTAKNGVVADLYARLGFSPTSDGLHWQAELAATDFDSLPCYIREEEAAPMLVGG